MKKSRIIIPALAVMALSMGAAVTSTVAWFTANRNASATSQQITLINPEGALEINGGAGIGTSVSDNLAEHTTTITHTNNFRDGSVNLVDGTAYTSSLDSNGSAAASIFRKRADLTDGTNIYVAQNYDLTFKYGNTSTKFATYGIFLDANTSGIQEDPTANGTAHVLKALRVGITTSTNKLVYAPATYNSLTEGSSFVQSESATNTYNSTYCTSASPKVVLADKTAGTTGKITTYTAKDSTDNKVGDILIDNSNKGPQSLVAKVWVWFEGTDAVNCINGIAGLDTAFQINLNFNVVEYTGV